MFGFLLKVVLVTAVVAGVGGVIYMRRGSWPTPESLTADLKNAVTTVNMGTVGKNLSASLDALITKPVNSPVVLGIQVTSDSLTTIVDVLQHLPPDQIDQIKTALCSPSATPSAR